ncbi:F0F1 ATP synthase subunit epsilon [Georgenia faecalis]|uniref:ATP synthase epsilon chain n=1 Tax=Georgenia faecalis TaxID=2483799 RepID=A0ABV9DBA0_9MICO|nr:F0F1 ATP synthase subunit epsilon [Georgenia faecalis]
MALTVHIVGPERTLWHGEASGVSVPAHDGDMGILSGHQPVLAVLRPGHVRITPTGGGAAEVVDVAGGFCSVDDDVVMVVVDNPDEPRAGDTEAAAGR